MGSQKHIILGHIAPLATCSHCSRCRMSFCVPLSVAELCKNGWNDRDAVWEANSRGSKEPCIRRGSRSPTSRGNLGAVWPTEKHWESVYPAKRIIQSSITAWHRDCCSRRQCPDWSMSHYSVRWNIHLLRSGLSWKQFDRLFLNCYYIFQWLIIIVILHSHFIHSNENCYIWR